MIRCLARFWSTSPAQYKNLAASRCLHANPSNHTSLAEPSSDVSQPDLQALLREKRIEQLMFFLQRGIDIQAYRVWARYNNLIHAIGHEHVPLYVHQAVLRKCTKPTHLLRAAAAIRANSDEFRENPHFQEDRLRAVIRNIRVLGEKPALDDYHFILEQFAATGHYIGARRVYRELMDVGLEPRSRTFGLCLQAIAHRLSLPIPEDRRSYMVSRAIALCHQLLRDMWKRGKPITSVNLDLAIRILKETQSMKDFKLLLKIGYGIDLSTPDHPPLDALPAGDDDVTRTLHGRLPFSTSALNTTIDFLGRLGSTSKMVQAFEVLTQPLQYLAPTFDSDDDLAGGANPPDAQQPFTMPHASPNTTTYNLLLKHLSRHGHAVFARHYLKQAVWLDHITDRAIRGLIGRETPLSQILAPRFSINRGTILPVFGLSNRDKNVELMRRVLVYMRRVIRRKRFNIEFYEGLVAEQYAERHEIPPPIDAAPKPPPPAPPTPPLDLDLNAPEPPVPALPPPPRKLLDPVLHVSILRKDLAEIVELYVRASDVLARTLQRVKERLGRRVWQGKDVYFITDGGPRRRVSREEWRRLVGFKAQPVSATAEEVADGVFFSSGERREPPPHLNQTSRMRKQGIYRRNRRF